MSVCTGVGEEALQPQLLFLSHTGFCSLQHLARNTPLIGSWSHVLWSCCPPTPHPTPPHPSSCSSHLCHQGTGARTRPGWSHASIMFLQINSNRSRSTVRASPCSPPPPPPGSLCLYSMLIWKVQSDSNNCGAYRRWIRVLFWGLIEFYEEAQDVCELFLLCTNEAVFSLTHSLCCRAADSDNKQVN